MANTIADTIRQRNSVINFRRTPDDQATPPSQANQKQHRTYRGHRRGSWISWDVDEVVELRARQRTFDGAYTRASLSCMGYGLFILKVFSDEFERIGLIYFIIGILLLVIAMIRRRRSDHDFSDLYAKISPQEAKEGAGKGRIWGRAFRTAAVPVILLSTTIIILDVTIFVFLMRL